MTLMTLLRISPVSARAHMRVRARYVRYVEKCHKCHAAATGWNTRANATEIIAPKLNANLHYDEDGPASPGTY